MSSQRVTVYNRTDGPVLIDAAGQTLGGDEYRSVQEDAAPVQLGIERGVLAVVQDPGGDLSGARPDAAEAFLATRKANARRKPVEQPAPADSSTDGDENKGA